MKLVEVTAMTVLLALIHHVTTLVIKGNIVLDKKNNPSLSEGILVCMMDMILLMKLDWEV